MFAVDTNVIVRLVLADNAEQTVRARNLIERETVLVRTTVLLETYWVLRRPGGRSHDDVLRSLEAVLGLPNTVVEEPERVRAAVDMARQGMGFADALHIAGLEPQVRFATFDRDLGRVASRSSAVPIITP